MNFFDEGSGINALLSNDIKSIEFPANYSETYYTEVRNFHTSITGYRATPLINLDNLAKELNLSKIYVKDESYRFGLNSFKSLGGTYAIAKYLSELLHINLNDVNFEYFKRDCIREKIKDMVFVTATDGNHGRGVAWASAQLGCNSVVFLPKGSALSRIEAIQQAGAETIVTDLNYDDTVRMASKTANKNGWHLIQDTSFQGYEKIPNWISQGYMTMVDEAIDQLILEGISKPTHVILQAGVGAMAGGVLGYMVNKFKGSHPNTIIVEPDQAACIYRSALIGDGNVHNVTGELNTIMAGLACGEPNRITWEILRDYAKAYISCPDYVSANGIRILANPIGDDERIISGESGSVGIGLLHLLMSKNRLVKLKKGLELDRNSVVLIFNTEGDTDPENYRRIVHEGRHASRI